MVACGAVLIYFSHQSLSCARCAVTPVGTFEWRRRTCVEFIVCYITWLQVENNYRRQKIYVPNNQLTCSFYRCNNLSWYNIYDIEVIICIAVHLQ